MHKMVVCRDKKKNLQSIYFWNTKQHVDYFGIYKNSPDYEHGIYQKKEKAPILQETSAVLGLRPLYDFDCTKIKKKTKLAVKSIQMIHQPLDKKKREKWVASPPIRGKKVKYKMFPSVLSRCGTGSLETCTHIISRPKTYSLFISTAETYYFNYLFYMGYALVSNRPSSTKLCTAFRDVITSSKQLIYTKQPAHST